MNGTSSVAGAAVPVGHYVDDAGQSAFRAFAPRVRQLAVVLEADGRRLPLVPDEVGYWTGAMPRLAPGTLYRLEADGQRLPDPASRCQPQDVHGPSMVVDIRPAHSPGWTGVPIEDAIVYELHVGTFTDEGTLVAAAAKLPHLQALGINVVELLPLAAFPGERNWGYDGTYLFALHAAYGDHGDLKAFIEAAHALGIAVILDVVYNHFGPEGNYSGALAPYTKPYPTPWGAAVNVDGAFNHGVRDFLLLNVRHWLETVGFDGMRMDAVCMIFDNMPVHILRQCTDLAREVGRRQGRKVIMIAEHLRNDRFVTADTGFGYDAQWNDDLNHAVFAHLTGERGRHYDNFPGFDDVLKALRSGFVLDGTRFDRHLQWYTGTDGRLTQPSQHVVHIQNHDQVGNRPFGDRMIATHGRAKALLGITAIMASPFVPMLFMGEEYGETAPFLFFEDFADAQIIEGVRSGRKADYEHGDAEPPDPHARASFVASKLQWARADSDAGRAILQIYRQLIALKRAGRLGPRRFEAVQVDGDSRTRLVTVQTPETLTVLNFSDATQAFAPPAGSTLLLATVPGGTAQVVPAYGVMIWGR